jgi:putative endonuclease
MSRTDLPESLTAPQSRTRKAQPERAPSGRRTYRQVIGQRAEDIAVEFLRARGAEILERNFRRRLGELDIVARDGETLAIVEVRTRASNRYGGAASSVDFRKQQRIVRAAMQLLQQRKDLARMRVRFDVVVVAGIGSETPQVQWLRHAFLT